MDKLDFLDGPQGPDEEVHVAEPEAVEVQPEPTPEPEPEVQPRDESGRFAPKVETPPEPPAGPPPGFVPIGVAQALREELRQAKQQPAPDIFEDTRGFLDHEVMQPINQQITNVNLHWSKRFAEQSYGAAAVNTAEQWAVQQAQIDPAFGQRIIGSPDPYGAAVTEYKQSQVLSKLSDPTRIDAFLAWEAAQSATQASPPPAAPAAPATPTPTRSLATSVPSSGGAAHVPSGPGQAFDNLFRN